MVKCRKLKSLFICVYRPPSTVNNEWSQAIEALDEAIELAQSNGEYDTVIVGGDFNFPNIIWEEHLPKISLNLNKQEECFVNFMFKNSLLNYVNKPTRKKNILDLVLTNDTELIGKCEVIVNSNFSDHNTVICETSIGINENSRNEKIMEYVTTVPNYGWRKGSVEQWDSYHKLINDHDWNEISAGKNVDDKVKLLFKTIEFAVKESFDNLIERKENKKRRIPKQVKKWFSQRKKLSKMIIKTKCKKKIVKLMEELDLIERKIYESKEKRRKIEEDKVIEEIKLNPKAFYKFAKKSL